MSHIIAFIVSILLYIGGGWCIYDVYISVFPIENTDTLMDIAFEQLMVYSCWAAIVNFMAFVMSSKNNDFYMNIGVSPIFIALITKIFPLSIGVGILINILTIASMTYCIGQWLSEKMSKAH